MCRRLSVATAGRRGPTRGYDYSAGDRGPVRGRSSSHTRVQLRIRAAPRAAAAAARCDAAQQLIAALLLLRWGYKLLLLRAGLHITAASQHHEARFNISLPSVATITASPPADGDGAGSRGGGRGQVAARLGGCAPDEALQWIPGCEQGAAPHALLPTAVRRRPQDRPYHVVVGHI
jgi:hypothetical protein